MRKIRPRLMNVAWTVFPIACMMALIALSASAAAPPENKTYFVVTLGLNADGGGPFEVGVGCVSFTDTDFYCEPGSLCGAWQRTDTGTQSRLQTSFALQIQMEDDETGNPIFVDGVGRVDDRGPKHTISIVARAREPISNFKMNFGFVGKPIRPNRCAAQVAAFEDGP